MQLINVSVESRSKIDRSDRTESATTLIHKHVHICNILLYKRYYKKYILFLPLES